MSGIKALCKTKCYIMHHMRMCGFEEGCVFNFSTGRVINKTVFDNEVTAMDHDHTGQLIFCGDAQGCVYTVSVNSHTGVLSRSHRNRNGSKCKSPVTTVQYRTFSLLARGPVLLTFTRDGNTRLFDSSMLTKIGSTTTQYPSFLVPSAFP
ncbi:hypothetical protein CsSME_00017507 [Camellia sinensis var. sinensis]